MASIQPANTVVFAQPSLTQTDPFKELNGNWSAGLMSCDNTSDCCYAYFCYCCFLCSLASKINESKCSCCCVPNVLAMYRMKVRSVLHIQGDSCNDHCATCCCPICAAVQIRQELRFRGLDQAS